MDIHAWLRKARACRASDVHLAAGQPPWLRIDGRMQRQQEAVLDAAELGAQIDALVPATQQQAYRRALEVDFSFTSDGARFRVNVFQQRHGPAAVFRLIPSAVPTLGQLQAPPVLGQLIHRPQGLILSCGATGSGKSTTLAAMVDGINRQRCGHLLTIEDPIEFIHSPRQCLVSQREVHRHTRSFGQALRAALREDPDYMLIGELRDAQSIRLALTAAETGHLVLATLHSRSAVQAVDRIIDVFAAADKPVVRAMLSESLQAVIAQTLLKRVGGGRIAAYEVMLGVPAIRHLIRENKAAQMYSVLQTGQRQGMCTLQQAVSERVEHGLIERQDAPSWIDDPGVLAR